MKTFSRHRFRERRGVNLDNNIISEEKANIKRRTFNLQYCVTDVFCGGGGGLGPSRVAHPLALEYASAMKGD